MFKNRFSFSAMSIIALLIFGLCVLFPVASQTYPVGKELYPAIYGALSELHPESGYINIDFYNNTYSVAMSGLALTTHISYQLNIRLKQNGEIEFSYENLYEQMQRNGPWTSARAFGLYNYNRVTSTIGTKIIDIANNQANYEFYEKKAMADVKFVYAIMKNLTELAFKDFIDNYARGSIFNIEGRITDVKEANVTINDQTYRYVVSLTQNVGEGYSPYLSRLFSNIYCSFYTNQNDVIRLSRTSVWSVSGLLTGANQQTAMAVNLEIIDAR